MFVWTTSLPLFPVRVKTSERSGDREAPAPAEPTSPAETPGTRRTDPVNPGE